MGIDRDEEWIFDGDLMGWDGMGWGSYPYL